MPKDKLKKVEQALAADKRARSLRNEIKSHGQMWIGSDEAYRSHEHRQNMRESEAEDQEERARRNRAAAEGKRQLTTDDKRL